MDVCSEVGIDLIDASLRLTSIKIMFGNSLIMDNPVMTSVILVGSFSRNTKVEVFYGNVLTYVYLYV